MNTEQRKQQKYRSIIEAAITAFLKNGVAKTAVDDIAKSASASKVTLYKYFGDKNGLQLSVCRHIIVQYTDRLDSVLTSDKSLVIKLMDFISILTDLILNNHQALCHELGSLNNDANKALQGFDERIKESMLNLIQQGKNEHLVYPDIDDISIYHYINMGLCYFQHNKDYRNKILHDASFKKEFMTLVWRNIFVDFTQFEV